MSSAVQFFSDYLSDNFLIERFSAFRKVFSKGFINHRLITIPRLIRSFTEIFKNIGIKIYCNSGFPFGWNNLASFGIFEIIFLFHIVSFPMVSLFEQILNGWYRHDMNKQSQLLGQPHLNQCLQTVVGLQRFAPLMSWQMGHKAPFLHRKSGFYVF